MFAIALNLPPSTKKTLGIISKTAARHTRGSVIYWLLLYICTCHVLPPQLLRTPALLELLRLLARLKDD